MFIYKTKTVLINKANIFYNGVFIKSLYNL